MLSLYLDGQSRNSDELEFPASVEVVERAHQKFQAVAIGEIQPASQKELLWHTALAFAKRTWTPLDLEGHLAKFRSFLADLSAAIQEFRPSYKSVVLVLSLVGIVVVAGSAYFLTRQQRISERPSAASTPPTAVQVSVFPEGAEVAIDGQPSARSILQTKL